jgi:hypothetical protein
MRKILVIGALLLTGAALGGTVFRGAVADAATPFENVIVGNTSTNPIPVVDQHVDNGNLRVHEEGTATVSGTVALGTTDGANLKSASDHLTRIDAAASKLSFDGSGSLQVAPQGTQTVHIDNSSLQVSGPAPMHTLFADEGVTITNDNATHTVPGSDTGGPTAYADYVSVGGLAGTSAVFFMDGSTPALVLDGPVAHGQESYTLNLTHPVAFTKIQVFCSNPTPCALEISVSGTSSP